MCSASVFHIKKCAKSLCEVIPSKGKEAVSVYDGCIFVAFKGRWQCVTQPCCPRTHFPRNNGDALDMSLFGAMNMAAGAELTRLLFFWITVHGQNDGKLGMAVKNGVGTGP